MPGAAELIQELSDAGIGVGLGSSSKNAQLILDNVELSSFFKVVVDGNHITLSKPDPEVFLKGAQAWGCSLQSASSSKMRQQVWRRKGGRILRRGLGDPEVLGLQMWSSPI